MKIKLNKDELNCDFETLTLEEFTIFQDVVDWTPFFTYVG